MKKVHLQLGEADRSHLQSLVSKSTVTVKVHRRATALLALDGWTGSQPEFSALARECLHRRIPSLEALEREVSVLVQERNAKAIQLTWQFSLTAARDKFARHYRRVRAEEPPLYHDI